MTRPEIQSRVRAERAKSRMSIALPTMAGAVFAVVVLGIVLYLVLR